MATLTTIAQNKDNWGELLIKNGKFIFLRDAEALRQMIQARLQVLQGEYFLNTTIGIDYNNILGSKNLPGQEEVVEVIEGLGYLLRVEEIDIRLENRQLRIDFRVESQFGVIQGGI